MNKLKEFYRKHELACAIFWIVLYTVGMGNLRRLGDDSPILMSALIVLSALMFLFVRLTGTAAYYGLTGWAKNSRAMLWFIPLWIIASLNLWSGFEPDYPMPGLLYAVIMMTFVGYAEEQIFRGFLFKAMLRDGSVKAAVIVSSLTFGIGHILNLFVGQDLVDTLNQVVFAVAVGFIFTMAFYKGGSLWPCILAHSVIDATSKLAPDEGSPVLNMVLHVLVLVMAVAYCLYLAKRVETPAINRISRQDRKTE